MPAGEAGVGVLLREGVPNMLVEPFLFPPDTFYPPFYFLLFHVRLFLASCCHW